MRFGFTLGCDVPPRPADLVEIVRTAEQLGFHSFYAADHVIIPRGIDEADEALHRKETGANVDFSDKTKLDVYDPILMLTYLASQVQRIRLGFSILVIPYRNPLLTAKMLSTLDVFCGGRLSLGVGTGWIEAEFTALQVPYERRGDITDEYLQMMVELWTKEYPEFHGDFYDVSNIAFLPKPVQVPHIPIMIGGNGPRALRRVADHGQGWQPLFRSPEELEESLATLRGLCEERGRDFDELAIVPSCRIRLGAAAALDGPRAPLTGTPAEVKADVERYEAAGADELILVIVEPDLDLDLLREKLEWFSTHVI